MSHDDMRARGRTNPTPTFDQFMAVRRFMSTLSFSPDGSQIAYSINTSGQFNLWRQPSAGGYPHQVTLSGAQAVRQISWSPDGETILYAADTDGDEFTRPYTIPAHGGNPSPFPSEPDVRNYLGTVDSWSPDGQWIAYGANDREPTDQDVVMRNRETGEIRRLVAGESTFEPAAWSPSGDRLTVLELKSNTDIAIYLVEIADGSVKRLTPEEAENIYEPGPWKADGSGFWMLTNEGREFTGLAFYDLATKTHSWVEAPNWDIQHLDASRDGKLLAWVVNENGYFRLYARDPETGADIALPDLPSGVIDQLTVSPEGDKIAVLLTRATRPTDVYVLDLKAGTTTRITDSVLGGLDEGDLIEPELILFESFDGRQIPGWLYRPQGTGPFPAILSIHGGPEAQELPQYNYGGVYQYWLSRGIGILAPNIRGSAGYGISYQKLIHRDWGGDDLKDMEAAAKYLQSLSWVDADRLGVFGGSYGGFACLSCVTRLPNYWAAAVDIVGPSNLVTFAKAVPPTWQRMMAEWMGDPYTEVDFLMERSPITYVDQVTAPLFVIQGANDPRVVKAESDQIVERLRARGIEVKYDVYEDEGHGFTRRENALKAYRDASAFFETHLLGDG